MPDRDKNSSRHYTNTYHIKATELPNLNSRNKTPNPDYFSTRSFMVLILVTGSLILLPLVLPPLPPPPSLLLLVPLAILFMLLLVAFVTSDIRHVSSPYL